MIPLEVMLQCKAAGCGRSGDAGTTDESDRSGESGFSFSGWVHRGEDEDRFWTDVLPLLFAAPSPSDSPLLPLVVR